MTAPLSNDLRHRVVKAIEGGLSRRAAAVKFDVSIASALRWYQRFKRTGSVEPDAIGGDHHSYRAEAHATRVLGWIDEQRDLTLAKAAGFRAMMRVKGSRGASAISSQIPPVCWLGRSSMELIFRIAMERSKCSNPSAIHTRGCDMFSLIAPTADQS